MGLSGSAVCRLFHGRYTQSSANSSNIGELSRKGRESYFIHICTVEFLCKGLNDLTAAPEPLRSRMVFPYFGAEAEYAVCYETDLIGLSGFPS
jgi:hypothetical protein